MAADRNNCLDSRDKKKEGVKKEKTPGWGHQAGTRDVAPNFFVFFELFRGYIPAHENL